MTLCLHAEYSLKSWLPKEHFSPESSSPSSVAVAPDEGLLEQGAVQCCMCWFGAALMAARAVKEEPVQGTVCVNGRSWPSSLTICLHLSQCLASHMGARFKRQYSLRSVCF